MDKNARVLVDSYGIDESYLEKFTPKELSKLLGACQEYGLDPAKLVDDYEMASKVFHYPKAPEEGIFASEGTLEFFLEQFGENPDKPPLEYLNSTYQEYLSMKEKVKMCVLPEERKDSRVNTVIPEFFEEIGIYKPQLQGQRVGGLLYGSFLFGDPSIDPDIDFDFVYCDSKDNQKGILETITKELQEYFTVKTHCTAINLDSYLKKIRYLDQREYHKIGTDEDIILDTTKILLSEPVWFDYCNNEPIRDKLAEAKENIDRLAEDNILIRGLLVYAMEEIVTARKDKKRPVYQV